MPASLVDNKFRAGKLHSGSKSGPLVTNPKQMVAIQLSEARKEGEDIPTKPQRNPKPKRKVFTRAGNGA
jgi:hypothetical protein